MPLNRRQIIELSNAIKERRDELIEELHSETADRSDPAEQADTDRDVAELQELDDARERLATGSYGACTNCGSDIEFGRLCARPGAARCLDCQERSEKIHTAISSGSRL